MVDGSGLAEAMLGLPSVRVTRVAEADDELVVEIETTEARAWCRRCGVRAESQDRMWVDVRDLECFGRPTRLRIWKRRWRCRQRECDAKTWTEACEFLDAQVVGTVALIDRVARPTVDVPDARSDCCGEFVERCRQP